jgi:uncharacterized membrane protein YecN with MAPEG domain
MRPAVVAYLTESYNLLVWLRQEATDPRMVHAIGSVLEMGRLADAEMKLKAEKKAE